MKLSIIVPIYKSQAILGKCIESILNQSYRKLQVVLVDDGSTDISSKICDNYQKDDSRIIVIHQANIGVSGARNSGLEVVDGEYIGFVDSDDYLQLDYYEELINLIHHKNPNSNDIINNYKLDIICCGYIYEFLFRFVRRYFYPSFYDGEYLNKKMIFQKLLPALFWEDVKIIGTLNSVWNKLIHYSLFEKNKIRFPENWNHAEDANVMIQCFCHANNVLFSHLCGYHHVKTLNILSLSTRFRPDFFALEIRFRNFLINSIGKRINQDFQNEHGYISIIKKANYCINNITYNINNENSQHKWLLYIFNNCDYRTAITNIKNELLDVKTIQCKKALVNNDYSKWYSIISKNNIIKYKDKIIIFIKKMILSFFFVTKNI